MSSACTVLSGSDSSSPSWTRTVSATFSLPGTSAVTYTVLGLTTSFVKVRYPASAICTSASSALPGAK